MTQKLFIVYKWLTCICSLLYNTLYGGSWINQAFGLPLYLILSVVTQFLMKHLILRNKNSPVILHTYVKELGMMAPKSLKNNSGILGNSNRVIICDMFWNLIENISKSYVSVSNSEKEFSKTHSVLVPGSKNPDWAHNVFIQDWREVE